MNTIPFIIISTAISLDGYIDDGTVNRLVISNKKDLDRVKLLRESCDGILVGANTIRKDNPTLLPKTEKNLMKVTISSSGNIDKNSLFFTTGTSDKIVYTVSKQVENLSNKLAPHATVVNAGEKIDLKFVLHDLYERGVKRLLVEGGSSILTQFLQEGLVSELHLAISGFFVGEENAPRFVQKGEYVFNAKNRMHLATVEKLDDIAVLVYKI